MFIEFVYLSGVHEEEHKRFILAPQSAQDHPEVFRDGVCTDSIVVTVKNFSHWFEFFKTHA